MKHLLISTFGFVMAFVFATPQAGNAQMLELTQTIYGMDCAPCAAGVEARIDNMEGTTLVELSLDEGEAFVQFADEHGTSLGKLQQTIIEGGFSPKDARIKVRGSFEREQDSWFLVTGSGDRFLLKEPANINPEEGKTVTLSGSVEARNKEDYWRLAIEG